MRKVNQDDVKKGTLRNGTESLKLGTMGAVSEARVVSERKKKAIRGSLYVSGTRRHPQLLLGFLCLSLPLCSFFLKSLNPTATDPYSLKLYVSLSSQIYKDPVLHPSVSV